MYGQLTLSDLLGIGGWNTKTQALIAGAPFPFPFRAFLPQPPPPLFAPATQATSNTVLAFIFISQQGRYNLLII